MNSSEMLNREKKAARMAAELFSANITAEEASGLTTAQWVIVANESGCNPPHSQATIDAVIANLVRMQAEAEADDKAEAKWEESQEYAGNRCPPRE